MDTSDQLYEHEATDWQRGLYEDVKETFRAPIVNWIFRTTMANYPAFLRYAWGQVKPAFQTRRFGRVSVEYRDAILSPIEAEHGIRTYRREDLDVAPAEYAELRRQLETFDVVAPRLALLFELVDRSLSGDPVGETPDRTRVGTEPLPAWLDRDRGAPPTMAAFDEVPPELDDTVRSIRAFHGLEDGLPSIYRNLGQWPGYLRPMWDDVEPRLQSDAFTTGRENAAAIVESYVKSLPYVPQLDPPSLRRQGLTDEAITDLAALFR
ncbi:MAG: halocarboxylic acid dehydrogenase DehI family protein, partial [Halanaeroarchaeum sp.]